MDDLVNDQTPVELDWWERGIRRAFDKGLDIRRLGDEDLFSLGVEESEYRPAERMFDLLQNQDWEWLTQKNTASADQLKRMSRCGARTVSLIG
jgi:hypothetical protein